MFSCFLFLRSESSNVSAHSDASTRDRGHNHCRITGQLRVHEAGQEVAVSVKTCSSSLSDTDLDEAPMIKTYGSLKGISREDLLELKSTLLASPKHLRVPRSPIRENIIQGGFYSMTVETALPASWVSRAATVLDTKTRTPQDFSNIGNMFNSGTLLELATQLLGIETMAVTLLDGNREVTRVATGFINLEATSKAPGSCRWVLLPTSHHMVIVEDTLRNPRTCTHRYVINEPHVRFYCSAPLIASDGHLFGTICALDKRPQRMDTDQQIILGNITALVSRELGKGWARQGQQVLQRPRTLRTRNSDQQNLMIVDVAAPGWRVLHMSQPAADRTGIVRRSQGHSTALWSIFALENQLEPWTIFAEATKQRTSFSVKGVCCNSDGMQTVERFNLMFRPAPKNCLGGDQQIYRGPSTVTQVPSGIAENVYFVAMCPVGRASSHRAGSGSKPSKGPLEKERRRSNEGRPMALKVIDEVS